MSRAGRGSWDILEVHRGLRGQKFLFCLFVCFCVAFDSHSHPPLRSVFLCFNCLDFLLVTDSALWPHEPSQSNILLNRMVSTGYVIRVGLLPKNVFKLQLPGNCPFLSNWETKRKWAKSNRKPYTFCFRGVENLKKLHCRDRIITVSEALVPYVPKASCPCSFCSLIIWTNRVLFCLSKFIFLSLATWDS